MPEPSLPTLLVPRAEAEEKITAQIKQGREILAFVTKAEGGLGFGLAKGFELAEELQTKWAKYTIDLLKNLFTGDSKAREFGPSWFDYPPTQNKIEAFKKQMNDRIQRLESIAERLPLFSSAAEKTSGDRVAAARPKQHSKNIFIVHGHDKAAMHEVARFIEHLDLHPIILHEQADKGRTIIEKFEAHADVGFAVILLTPDDIGYPRDVPGDAKHRARQNVLFELGFFIGSLGRQSVCVLRKGKIETPTDYSGVLYKTMDESGGWKIDLAKEMKAAGIEVDLSRIT